MAMVMAWATSKACPLRIMGWPLGIISEDTAMVMAWATSKACHLRIMGWPAGIMSEDTGRDGGRPGVSRWAARALRGLVLVRAG